MTVAEAVTLIGAITAAVVSIMTVYLQARTAVKVDEVHHLVNSQSEVVGALHEQLGLKTGELVGRDYVPPEIQKT